MAVYQAVITNAGRTLFSQAAVGGGQVLPVRISTGDGTLGATDPTTLSSLVHRVQDYSISSSNALVPYQSTYQFLIDSSHVTATYQLREVGLIAKLSSGGPETLIYYSYTTGSPDTISPSSGYNATIDFNTLTITFSNTPNTSATLTAAIPPALHAITHLQRTDGTSTDPIPIATTSDVGLVPRTPNDPGKVLVGTATASWATVPRIVGEIIDYAGATPPIGWLICDGNPYPTASFPALFAVIGYNFGGSGANFNVPDCRGRASIGAGHGPGLTYNRPLASKGGEEKHSLSIEELALHSHAVNDNGHSHLLTDNGHSHGITQSNHAHTINEGGGHSHGVIDPQHQHIWYSSYYTPPVGSFAQGSDRSEGARLTEFAATGISIQKSGTGIIINGSNANITINSSGVGGTGISVQNHKADITNANTGSSVPHENMPPYLVFNKLIKY